MQAVRFLPLRLSSPRLKNALEVWSVGRALRFGGFIDPSNPENLFQVKQGKWRMNRGWSVEDSGPPRSVHLLICRTICHQCDDVPAPSGISWKGES